MKTGIKKLLIIASSGLFFSFFFFATTAFADVLSPGTITACGELAAPGTYTLDDSEGAFDVAGPCFTITSPGVIIDGSNVTQLLGDVDADGINSGDNGFDFTFYNIVFGGFDFNSQTYAATTSSLGNGSGHKGTITFDSDGRSTLQVTEDNYAPD